MKYWCCYYNFSHRDFIVILLLIKKNYDSSLWMCSDYRVDRVCTVSRNKSCLDVFAITSWKQEIEFPVRMVSNLIKFNLINLLFFNFPLVFSFVYFLLHPVWVSFFSRFHSFSLVEMGVLIGGVLCWVCEIVRLFFLLIVSIVSFRAFGS